jgi:RHS repeat-associated protein
MCRLEKQPMDGLPTASCRPVVAIPSDPGRPARRHPRHHATGVHRVSRAFARHAARRRTAAQGCAARTSSAWTRCHEHLDALGIIHMNGRIYDPRLARFLQADPLIEHGSTLNRYTYVHNDPLAYTDPSGYWGRREQRALRTIVAIAITVWTGVNANALLVAEKTGHALALAMAGGAVAGGIQSGTVEGATWGAFSAAVFGERRSGMKRKNFPTAQIGKVC